MTRGSLPLDVKTRWNSTFLMLSRALQFKIAFDRMEAEDRLYNDYFLEVDNGVKRCGPPTSRDWKAVEKLIRFLVIFYNSTLIVSASSKVNAFKCYGEIVTIERNLTGLVSSLDSELKLRASEMLKKFSKYWGGMKGVNKMLILATIFDPTQKMHFAKLCFEKLYGKDSFEAKEMTKTVTDLLTSMFKEYSMRFKRASGQASQEAEASAVPGPDSQEQGVERMELVVEDFGYERMDAVYKELVAEIGEDTRDELEVYLKEAVVTQKLLPGMEFDVLSWWKMHRVKYPVLAEMARDLLAMQVSSVASESAFSTSGRILEPHRSCLTHYMIEVIMCTEQWLHADIKLKETIITNEQILEDVEELDKLEKEFEAHNLGD
ncbi:zinc finger BED domain-containing protein RICESLEEPER 2-like [Raphanus sativus]|nr:zinc finger BED domain-containing protein RICESLEEPER 2-like [Raphanus sativus]